jgi:hypothetical protein
METILNQGAAIYWLAFSIGAAITATVLLFQKP